MSIYITGDTHGDFRRFSADNFPEGKTLTKKDYVIICGDFGGIWDVKESSPQEKYWLDWLNGKPWTTLFVDGNHSNFDRLNSLPVERWHEGYVHIVRSSILHLMRGNRYIIDNCSIFAYGGAPSHDVYDGILDRENYQTEAIFKANIKKYQKQHKAFRINHISWWKEEIPNEEERKNALKNLAENDYKVDYILTHEAPSSDVVLMDHLLYHPDEYSKWLEMEIRQKVKYKKWFFGHYHLNLDVNEKETCLFERRIRIV